MCASVMSGFAVQTKTCCMWLGVKTLQTSTHVRDDLLLSFSRRQTTKLGTLKSSALYLTTLEMSRLFYIDCCDCWWLFWAFKRTPLLRKRQLMCPFAQRKRAQAPSVCLWFWLLTYSGSWRGCPTAESTHHDGCHEGRGRLCGGALSEVPKGCTRNQSELL